MSEIMNNQNQNETTTPQTERRVTQRFEFPQPSEEDKAKLVAVAEKQCEDVLSIATTTDKASLVHNTDAPSIEVAKTDIDYLIPEAPSDVEIEDLEGEEEKEISEDTPTPVVTEPERTTIAKPLIPTDEDLDLFDDDDDDDIIRPANKAEKSKKEKIEEVKEGIRKNMEDKFVPFKNKIDVSVFEVQKKPISASKVLNHIRNSSLKTSTAVLFNTTKKVIEVSEYSSSEIQKMNPQFITSENYYTLTRDKYETLYNHIVDPNKPLSFEAWLKTMDQDSIEDYFFAAYKATFGDANIITYSCEESEGGCGNIFLNETPIGDMIKFKNEDIKKQYNDLLHLGQLNVARDSYTVGRHQVTDEYVIDFKHPSLYEQVIEPTLLDPSFVEKYQEFMTLISYIDSMYVIDRANHKLIPVELKVFPNSPSKTLKTKIKVYSTIINTFTSDQYQNISIITDLYDLPDSKRGKKNDDDNTNDISYIYPSCKCPKCGKILKEREVRPDLMLFTRHQLGAYRRV